MGWEKTLQTSLCIAVQWNAGILAAISARIALQYSLVGSVPEVHVHIFVWPTPEAMWSHFCHCSNHLAKHGWLVLGTGTIYSTWRSLETVLETRAFVRTYLKSTVCYHCLIPTDSMKLWAHSQLIGWAMKSINSNGPSLSCPSAIAQLLLPLLPVITQHASPVVQRTFWKATGSRRHEAAILTNLGRHTSLAPRSCGGVKSSWPGALAP